MTAMQLIGAGRTVLISASAPLFVMPFSVMVLKEKPTLYATIGVLVCVSGVVLVSIG
ncbi:MAG: EamA family transporter [Dethiobacter sp.]|nr:EamA family transporter [Dethiobacter sp.]